MPNLLPDYGWVHPAGRLIWASILTFVGIGFVFALMKPPVLKRPFPTSFGIALYAVIPAVGWVIAGIIPDDASLFDWSLDAVIVDLVLIALVAHTFLMVISRQPRDPSQGATWAECFLGAIGAFALMTLGYAVVPHEWLTYANSYLQWGNNSKYIWRSNQQMLFFPWNWPFDFNFPALRDIVVTVIYIFFLGLNVKLFVMWQDRNKVPTEAPAAGVPERRSRFGRPLRRWGVRAAEARSATAPVGDGS
jgi:hypothetical protein